MFTHRGHFLRIGSGAHLRDDAAAVIVCGGVGINIQHRQPGCSWYCHRLLAKGDAEHFIEIGGGIGADQQYAFAGVGQRQRYGSGHRSFADTTLAGKEQVAGRSCEQLQQNRHGGFQYGERGVDRHVTATTCSNILLVLLDSKTCLQNFLLQKA